MPVRKTKVTIGDPPDESPPFDAYVKDGEQWNGWAVPYFTEANADKVMDWINATDQDFNGGEVLRITKQMQSSTSIIYQEYDGNAAPYPQSPPWLPELLALDDGTSVTTWSIGGGSWTWEEVPQVIPELAALINQNLDAVGDAIKNMRTDSDRAWARGWTLLADNSIAPLDHRLRDLLRVHDDSEFAKAPPRVRAALSDLLESVTAMLGKLPY
jgi:hypothetical protein